MQHKLKLATLVLTTLLASGCSTHQNMYHWGQYQNVVRQMYVEPGEVPAEVQIEKLSADLQLAEAKGMKVAPGVYAHLAMMYASTGRPLLANEALEHERQLFPESATMISTLINNQQAGVQE